MTGAGEFLEQGDGWTFANIKVTAEGLVSVHAETPLRRLADLGIEVDDDGLLTVEEAPDGVLVLRMMIPLPSTDPLGSES
ncbi:hypothetical protein N8K70_14480 [Microbacterium betulae]|uniref:Uncharacterized protein n=1 Tax=Microbacterium betulae TaxID=2981139 RepID=A0AA97FFB0_9MICO|nr:hypothetical protein [Microbacterium sp. AB]WOF22586.1 hypothetical protein N8K70_14480 [Microbacterium sp. AB]